MADFDALDEARKLDELAYACARLPSTREIEMRECTQKLQAEVDSVLTSQERAREIGLIYESTLERNGPALSLYLGRKINFADSHSPRIAGFTYTASNPSGRPSYNEITVTLPSVALKPTWGLTGK